MKRTTIYRLGSIFAIALGVFGLISGRGSDSNLNCMFASIAILVLFVHLDNTANTIEILEEIKGDKS